MIENILEKDLNFKTDWWCGLEQIAEPLSSEDIISMWTF